MPSFLTDDGVRLDYLESGCGPAARVLRLRREQSRHDVRDRDSQSGAVPGVEKGPVRIARLLKALDLGRAAAALTGPELAVILEHDGHVANVEQPKAFNEVLVGFLEKLD